MSSSQFDDTDQGTGFANDDTFTGLQIGEKYKFKVLGNDDDASRKLKIDKDSIAELEAELPAGLDIDTNGKGTKIKLKASEPLEDLEQSYEYTVFDKKTGDTDTASLNLGFLAPAANAAGGVTAAADSFTGEQAGKKIKLKLLDNDEGQKLRIDKDATSIDAPDGVEVKVKGKKVILKTEESVAGEDFSFDYTVISKKTGGSDTASVDVAFAGTSDDGAPDDGDGDADGGADGGSDPGSGGSDGGGSDADGGDSGSGGSGGSQDDDAGGGSSGGGSGGGAGSGGSGGNTTITWTGTAGNDDFTGTDAAERIEGLGGDDILNGLAGGDRMFGGSGDDTIAGDTGILTIDAGLGGNDELFGEDGSDWLDGGSGDDDLYGGDGSDYMFGGFGGRDYLEGGADADRMGGGFRGPGENPTANGTDSDVMFGNSGADIFEARFWFRPGGWQGYANTKILGPSEDIVADFKPGEDRLDVVYYSQAANFEFTRGGFDLLDSNGDNLLDGDDTFVAIENITVNGSTKSSIVLDVGGASVAGGRFSGNLLDGGEHKLAVFGQQTLVEDDFVPEKTYTGRFQNDSSDNVTFGAGNDWVTGKGGNDRIDAGGGDDLIRGQNGGDTFVFNYTNNAGPGFDVVEDFLKGQDLLDGFSASGQQLTFALLDSSGDGRVDGGDEAVRLDGQHQLIAPGTAPEVAPSLSVDLDVAYGLSDSFSGENGFTLHGVDQLVASDFVNQSNVA